MHYLISENWISEIMAWWDETRMCGFKCWDRSKESITHLICGGVALLLRRILSINSSRFIGDTLSNILTVNRWILFMNSMVGRVWIFFVLMRGRFSVNATYQTIRQDSSRQPRKKFRLKLKLQQKQHSFAPWKVKQLHPTSPQNSLVSTQKRASRDLILKRGQENPAM